MPAPAGQSGHQPVALSPLTSKQSGARELVAWHAKCVMTVLARMQDTGAQGGMGQAQWGSRESLHQPEQ